MKRLLQEADFYGVEMKKVVSSMKKKDKLRNSTATEVRFCYIRLRLATNVGKKKNLRKETRTFVMFARIRAFPMNLFDFVL